MTIRWFKALSAVMIACVALVGCGGNAQLEPEPSPEGTVFEEKTEDEQLIEDMGADAAEARRDEPAAKE